MTVFLARALICVLLAGFVAMAAEAAEKRAPIRLIPSDKPPAARTTPEPEQRAPQTAPPVVQTVLSAPAKPSDPDSAGLPGFEGGFGLPLWRGSSKAAVARLLDALPQTVASPALKGVLFRVLAAGAAPPEGEGPRLAPLRVRQLGNLGRDKEAAELAEAAGLEAPPPAAGSEAIDPALASGDLEAACAAADAEMMRAPSAYVQRAAAFCAAKAGNVGRARLILDILREVDASGDPLFEGLMLRAMAADADSAPPLPDDGSITPLNVAMLGWLNEAPPEVWSLRSDPAAVRARAGLVQTEAEAEEAVRNGRLPPKALLAKYLRPSDTEHPRALLARAAVEAAEPNEKMQALTLLWQDAAPAGLLTPLAAATVDLAADILPSPELAGHTGPVVLAALAAGRFDIAERWYADAVERGAALEEDSRHAVLAWPLMKLADAHDRVPEAEDGLRRWLEAGGDEPPYRRAAMLFALLEAVGEPVEQDDWTALLTGFEGVTAELPAPVIWRGLNVAGQEGKIGEAVLYAVIASAGRARGDPATAVAIVRALARVGLAAEARAYALECLIESAAS
ncbi:MAG: hypothetical protein F4Y03_06180 [Alphaproteobacteria bacterium]|nr:hypothetical protein [Alphaproteobacteria bacterium]